MNDRLKYGKKLGEMNDEALFKETKDQIWLSAYAENNRRSEYHWKVRATYNEWVKRGKPIQYQTAHKEVLASLS